MSKTKLFKDLDICGVVLCTKSRDFFAVRCVTCCGNAEDGPVLTSWASFQSHAKKKHMNSNIEIDRNKFQQDVVYGCHKNIVETKAVEHVEKIKIEEFPIIATSASAILDVDEIIEEDPVSFVENEIDMNLMENSYAVCEATNLPVSTDFDIKIEFDDVAEQNNAYTEIAPSSFIQYDEKNESYEEAPEDAKVVVECLEECDEDWAIETVDSSSSEEDESEHDDVQKETTEPKQVDIDNIRDYADIDHVTVTKTRDCKKHVYIKRICFAVLKNEVADTFFSLLQEKPTLWADLCTSDEVVATYESWIEVFKKRHGITFVLHDMQMNLKLLRQHYYKVKKQKNPRGAGKKVLDQCNKLVSAENVKTFYCDHCNRFYSKQIVLQAHVYEKHQIGENPYQCKECEQEFSKKERYDNHMRIVHAKKLEHACTMCERSFNSRALLEHHMPIHTGINRYVCASCGKSFRKRESLTNHEIRVHLRQRNFSCEMCPKTFYTKPLLKDHMNMHLGIKNFICPFCSKAFHSSHALMRHKQIHSEVKRYTCNLCDAAFHQFVGLNAHRKNKHKFISADNEKEPNSADI